MSEDSRNAQQAEADAAASLLEDLESGWQEAARPPVGKDSLLSEVAKLAEISWGT